MINCEREVWIDIAVWTWWGHDFRDEVSVCKTSVAYSETGQNDFVAFILEVG